MTGVYSPADTVSHGGANRGTLLQVVSPRTWIIGAMLCGVVVALTAVDLAFPASPLFGLRSFAAALLTLAPIAMTVIVVPTARDLDADSLGAPRWTLIGVGMTSISMGNVIFVTLYATSGKDPYPSIADVFTLGMYASIAAAFYLSLAAQRAFAGAGVQVMISALVTAVLASSAYLFALAPVMGTPVAQQGALHAFNLLYLGLDAFGLVLPCIALTLLALRRKAGCDAWPPMLLLAGAIALAITDVLFTRASYVGAGRNPLIDAGYAIAPLLVGLAVLVARDAKEWTDGARG